MLPSQRTCFNLTRNDQPLNEYELTDPIDTGIATSRAFIELQALKQWGAGIDVLKSWRDGEIDQSLLDLAVYFYLGDQMYEGHRKDAIAIEQHNRMERAKRKK